MRIKDIDRINSIVFIIEQFQEIPNYSVVLSKHKFFIVIYTKTDNNNVYLEITFKPIKYSIIKGNKTTNFKRLDTLHKELKRLIK